MSEITTMLSERENRVIEQYAKSHGIEPEEALKELSMSNLSDRLKFQRQRTRGEVRTLELPKSEGGGTD